MLLKDYCDAKYGNGAQLARDLNVVPVMISQWVRGKPVPEERGPAIEWFTQGQVTAEEVCPHARWVRVRDADWPRGKPLLDKSPEVQATAVDAATAAG
jgi:DNA-binding transcriptional regulator YdaS (Cro superfamily)